MPALPAAITNNAVAAVTLDDGVHIVSFLGLTEGKTHAHVTTTSYALAPAARVWVKLPPPPGPGRLAATAVSVGQIVYLFGGYTVAEDGGEQSIETVHAFDPRSRQYRELAPMPIPVDDTLSAVHADRYIYLVSGWHDSGNVNLVQAYDTTTDSWFQATPFPGRAVFGQAGGIAGGALIVCGGVYVKSTLETREFAAEQDCMRGDIRPQDPTRIDWKTIKAHPGPGRYRAAATGLGDEVIFAGGSDNPYNFNGVGYNGTPSEPSAGVFAFNVVSGQWRSLPTLSSPSMDHRGLLVLDQKRLAIVGGMLAGQTVSRSVATLSLDSQ